MMNRIKTLAWVVLGLALLLPETGHGQEPDSLAAATAQARRTGIVIAAELVMPAVVSITVLQTRTYSSPFWIDPFFEEFFGNLLPHEYSREIQSLGSGLIVSADGKIVTNAHVVADANKIKVTLADGRTFDTNVMGIDAALDLALLKLVNPPDDLQAARLGNSDDLMIGEWAIALGNPFGFLIADAKPSVTAGVISATGRRVQIGEAKRFSYSGVIQTDAAINPGNSGGPLTNIAGEVIGINTFIFTKSGGSEGIGFAIPANQVKKFIYELQSHAERRIAWLGLGVQTLTSDMARALGIPGQRGIIVTQIFKNTPAQRGNLKEAWVITAANGINYASESDWQMMEQGLFVGDSVRLEGITDEGKPFVRTLQAIEYITPAPVRIAALGIQAMDLDPAIRYRYNIRSLQGVVVLKIERGSRGAELGLNEGDVILAYGSTETPNISELKKAVRSVEDPRTLVIEREGGRYRIYRGF
ncbi:MAG: trypsin-like peptidase domain-containing protein [candidate division WOR-3 bacterium]|nr:trypsin-like peptidase domain-containing protein [candidate division WOR-3 bacterium]